MTTFAETMREKLRSIEKRAKAVGSNMTQVCKNTGVARVTYERWRDRAPQSVAKVDVLDQEVSRLEREAAAKAGDAAK